MPFVKLLMIVGVWVWQPDSFVCEVQLVGEVYSDTNPVASEAARRGHVVGAPKTLASGYNFLVSTDRARAKAEIARDAPFCLVLAFPCSKWSPLMRLNWGQWMKDTAGAPKFW